MSICHQEREPLVSIIIPVYNGEMTISRAIESVQQQEYHNLEILVINNGSTDHTENIVKHLIMDDSRIRLIESQKGRSKARNKGILLAKGKYINFLDADDTLCTGHLRRSVSSLSHDSNLFAYIEETQIIKLDKTVLIQSNKFNDLKRANFIEISAVMFKNKDLIMFLDYLEHNEDWLFWIQNLIGKEFLKNSKESGVQKFVTGNNTMSDLKNMIGSQIIVYAYGNIQISFLLQVKLILAFFGSQYSKNKLAINKIKKMFNTAYLLSQTINSIPIVNSLVEKKIKSKIDTIQEGLPY